MMNLQKMIDVNNNLIVISLKKGILIDMFRVDRRDQIAQIKIELCRNL